MFLDIYFGSLLTVLGLIIGSFLNVCIYRIPIKETIVRGNSHCMSCSAKIKAYDLIPLFSYLILGGKCRKCKESISPRYPLVELFNGMLYLLIFLTFGSTLKTILYCALASVLIVVSLIDFDTQEISNGLIIFILCLSPIAFITNDIPYWQRLIGFFAASLILLIITIFTNGFGYGDIKLMAVCGLIIGYKNILLALFLGVIIGGIIGCLILFITKKKARNAMMPFGPALSAGILITMFYGSQIINWYLSLLY